MFVDGKASLNRYHPDRGPWVVERVLGVEKLGADRKAEACAETTLARLRSVARTPEGFEHIQKVTKFFTADNAADEVKACQVLTDTLPQNAVRDPGWQSFDPASHQKRLSR